MIYGNPTPIAHVREVSDIAYGEFCLIFLFSSVTDLLCFRLCGFPPFYDENNSKLFGLI